MTEPLYPPHLEDEPADSERPVTYAPDDPERPFTDARHPRSRRTLELVERYGGPAKVPEPPGGWNAPMTSQEICVMWPGAHLGVTREDEPPRWVMRPHRRRGCCTPCKGAT